LRRPAGAPRERVGSGNHSLEDIGTAPCPLPTRGGRNPGASRIRCRDRKLEPEKTYLSRVPP
jgi:hypothetical protein